MKKITMTLFVLGLILTSFNSIDTISYKAVVAESEITWAGSRPGKTHDGTLSISDGNFIFEQEKLVSGNFTLNMESIKVLDIEPGKMNDKLVNHFKSSDFFDVSNHPTANYKITGSEAKDNMTLVQGELTLKGITKEVSFLADVTTTGETASIKSAEFKIDRTKWDIKFRSGSFFDGLKNKLIYDDITLTVKVTGKK